MAQQQQQQQRREVAHVWLVASISEANCRPGVASSHVAAGHHTSKPWLLGRPSSFATHEGGRQLLGACGHEAGASSVERFSPSIDSFSVPPSSSRRIANLPSFGFGPYLDLDLLQDLDPAALLSHQATNVANLVRHHFLPKASILMAAQRHAVLQVERAGRWFGLRRASSRSGDDAGQVGGAGSGRGGRQEASRASEARLAAQALQAERQLNPEAAAALYMQLVALAPTAENYARLSKQYTDMAYVTVPPLKERMVECNTKAVEVAHQAVDADPSCCMGHIARCVSRGRLALVSDNRTKVQLAKDAADDAVTALRLDPNNDVAHHLMGRWHYEMAQINAVARYLIRLFFGTSLMQGTFQESLVHFRAAADICPGRMIHRVEIGRTLLKLGDRQGAAEALTQALDMEIEDINAHLQLQDAVDMLKKLGEKRGLFLLAPQPKTKVPPQ